jgi:hypothetical protein
MDYRMEDLQVFDDPVRLIRRIPLVYGGEPPRGRRLAAWLMGDLIHHGDVPAHVEAHDGWWLIICEKDWLLPSVERGKSWWFRIVSTPEVGPESMRSEVILTALCERLFTIAGGTVEWINGEGELPRSLARRVKKLASSNQIGRAVAFLAD